MNGYGGSSYCHKAKGKEKEQRGRNEGRKEGRKEGRTNNVLMANKEKGMYLWKLYIKK